jgi:hypothetical protein
MTRLFESIRIDQLTPHRSLQSIRGIVLVAGGCASALTVIAFGCS